MSNGSRTERRTALVFGGSRGIGAAAASRRAAVGFAVAQTYVSRPDKAAEVVSAIEAAGGTALSIRADSADPTAIRAATAQTAEALGQIDVVVVNAGIIRIATVDAFTLEDLDLMLAVNVRGVFLAIQAAASHMRDGGRIITIGSNTAVS